MSDGAWKVVPGAGGKMGFVSGGNLVRASCHHKADGACGGCYARLMTALEVVLEDSHDGASHVRALFDELKREGER